MSYTLLRDLYDSDEEVYAHWWLQELKDHKIIEDFERAESYQLTESVQVTYTKTKKLKTKTKVTTEETELLSSRIYTPDFKITLCKTNNLFQDINKLTINPNSRTEPLVICQDNKAIIEVKGVFNNHNMVRLFRINQKELYSKYGVYSNLLIVPTIFYKTFVPNEFLTTNVTNKPRKVKKKTSIKEYLKTWKTK